MSGLLGVGGDPGGVGFGGVGGVGEGGAGEGGDCKLNLLRGVESGEGEFG